MNNPIRLGLCCINNKMRTEKPPIYSSRTARLSTIEKDIISIRKGIYKVLDKNEFI